jgi:hypothetical protein
MNRIIPIVTALALSFAAIAGIVGQTAFAADEHSGFGEAASTIGSDMGCHSSSFDTPRLGIGNVASLNNLTVWELGAFLLGLVLGGATLPGC